MKKIVLMALFSVAPLLANADTASQQQAYIKSSFKAMDANGDGKVDAAEYIKYMQARFDRQGKALDTVFNDLDKDRDGKLSRAEAAVEPDIARYFDGLDTNKDGFLLRGEVQQALMVMQTTEY